MMGIFDQIYEWQENLSEIRFKKIKIIFSIIGWFFIISSILLYLIFNHIFYIFLAAEGMLILFVTVMNLDNASCIFSTVLWLIGLNILFVLIFSGLINHLPVRLR